MNEAELFRRLAVALAIGLLIGLERGWQTRDESDSRANGRPSNVCPLGAAWRSGSSGRQRNFADRACHCTRCVDRKLGRLQLPRGPRGKEPECHRRGGRHPDFVHNLFNRRWYGTIAKGRPEPRQLVIKV